MDLVHHVCVCYMFLIFSTHSYFIQPDLQGFIIDIQELSIDSSIELDKIKSVSGHVVCTYRQNNAYVNFISYAAISIYEDLIGEIKRWRYVYHDTVFPFFESNPLTVDLFHILILLLCMVLVFGTIYFSLYLNIPQ